MTEQWDAAKEIWQNHAPMRLAAKPEEIADLVAMLVAADYITPAAA